MTENQWFGPRPYGPMKCEASEWVPTPVGEPCLWCDEPLVHGNVGVLIVYVDASGATRRPIHHACAIRQIVGSLAHLEGRCECVGGVDDREERGLTKRHEALLVWERTLRK